MRAAPTPRPGPKARLSTQSAAAARNEIEPKRDFCRHCSQTREGHWASGTAGSRLSNAGRWPLAASGPRCPRRGHGTPVSVEGSDPDHVMAHTLGSTCAEVFLLGNPGCSFRKRESGCRQGASRRPRRGLTCRGASCCGLLPPGPLAPEDAGLPVLAVPSAQMLLLPLRSTRVVTAGVWQARGCPPRQ